MIERTTSLGTKLQSLLSEFPIRVVTCIAGNKICSNLSKENSFPAIVWDICCSEPGFSGGYNCILCFRTMMGTFLLMWTNNRWIHMWICFLPRLCYTRLHGWESWMKHQFRCTIFMSILWFKDEFCFTWFDAYKHLQICFFFWWH